MLLLSICLPLALVNKKQRGHRDRDREREKVREVDGHPTTLPLHLVIDFSKKGRVSCVKDSSTLYCQGKLADVKLGGEAVKVGHETAL